MKARQFYLAALFLWVYSLHSNGQTLSFQWSRQFDAYGLKNMTKAVAADVNGNVYTAGWSQHGSASDEDYVISKYNSAGTRKWTVAWNPGSIDEPASIAVSGGYVYVTGKTKQGSYNVIGTTKLDTTVGNTPSGWPEYFSSTGANSEGVVVKVGQAGDVFVAGTIYKTTSPYADYIVLKYPPSGGSTFTQYGPEDISGQGSADTLVDMVLDANDNVYVAGSTTTSGNENYCAIKLNSSLVQQWMKQYDYTGVSNGYDCPAKISVDRSLNVIVTGTSFGGSFYPNDDIATVKYNSSGTQLYVVRQTENLYGSWESAADMVLDTNNNIYITGSIGYQRGGGGGLIAMKYDTTLTQKWYTRVCGALSSPALARRIAVDAGGNNTYTVFQVFSFTTPVWTTNKDILIQRYDASGHAQEGIRFDASFGDGGIYGPKDSATSIATDGVGGNIFIGGTTTSTLDTNQGLYGVVLKVNAGTAFRSSAAFVSVGPENAFVAPRSYQLSQNYPNPFNPSTRINFTLSSPGSISLKVYDITGREVETLTSNQYYSAGAHEIRFDGSNHASGIYFYRLFSADGKINEVKKMVLMK